MSGPGGKPTSGSRLYIGGLSLTATQKDVEELFGQHGKITEVRMNRNFAFVQFSDEKEAASAMEAIGGQVHFGRKLDVQYARAPRNQNQNQNDNKGGDDGGRDRSPLRGGSGGMRGGMRGGSGGAGGGGGRNFGGGSRGGGPAPFGNDSWNDDFKGGFGGGGGGGPGAGGGGPGDFRGGGGGGGSGGGGGGGQDFFGRGGNNDGPFGGRGGPGGGPGGMNDYGRDGFGGGGRAGGRDMGMMDNRGRPGGGRFSGGGNDFRDSPPFRGGGPDSGMGGGVGGGGGLDLGAPYRNQGMGGRMSLGGGMGGGGMGGGGMGGGGLDMGGMGGGGGGSFRGGMDSSGPKPQLSPWQKDLPPTQAPVPLNTSNNDRTNDIEIIVVHKSITDYGEYIEGRLKSLGFSVDVLFPHEAVALERVVANIASRGTLYAVIVTPVHQINRSLTLQILHGSPQEHRNMPVDDALTFILRNFEQYSRMCAEKKGGNCIPEQVRHLLEQVITANRTLTAPQYDILIQFFLREKMKVEPTSANDTSTSSQQAELQTRILSILNKNTGAGGVGGGLAGNTANLLGAAAGLGGQIAGALAGGPGAVGETQSPLLKDPSVQRALDSLIQGGGLLQNLSGPQGAVGQGGGGVGPGGPGNFGRF